MKNYNFINRMTILFLCFVLSIPCKAQNISKKEQTIPEGVEINGIVWATRNVGAPGTFALSPEDPGMFYQWNNKIGWSTTNPLINSNGGTTWSDSVPVGVIWEKNNDPCPIGWRVPAIEEIKELLDKKKVDRGWRILNERRYMQFTDKATGNSIFLRAAGYRFIRNGILFAKGRAGFYWSSTVADDKEAYHLVFDHANMLDSANAILLQQNFHRDNSPNAILLQQSFRNFGFSVRCVSE